MMRNLKTYKWIRRASAVLLTTLVLVGSSVAQDVDGVGDRLGVYEAIEVAYVQSPVLNTLRAQIDAKQGQWWTGFGIHPPALTYTREGIGSGTYAEQRLAVSQAVDFPLTSYYRLKRTDTEQDALVLTLDAESARLKAAVKKAYTDLLYTQELVHLRSQEVRLADELLAAAAVRVEVGEASGLEQMKAEVQRAEAQSSLEDARRQFQNARYDLFNLVGLDPDAQRYEIVFSDTLVYIDVAIDQAQVLARIDVQPELQSAARTLDAAHLGVKQTRSSLLPALQFDIYPQDFGEGYDRFGFQVGLRLPLWVVPNYRGSLRMAKAEVQQQAWQQQAVYLDLKKRVEQAWHGYETSKQVVDRYRTIVRARSEELLARTQEGYLLGELDLLTLLDTQRTYLASELRFYDALRDYYFQLIDLERFLGEDLVFNPAYEPAYSDNQPAR